jgi:ketosteroid isomerase-like protein
MSVYHGPSLARWLLYASCRSTRKEKCRFAGKRQSVARYWAAMSRENVELALRALEAFKRRDVDALVAFLGPDVVWEENPELPGLREVYHGPAEVREWMVAVLEVFENLRVEVVELKEVGDDRVFAETVLTARGKGSGVPVELRFWTVLWFAESKITRRQVSWTRDQALEGAGLSE